MYFGAEDKELKKREQKRILDRKRKEGERKRKIIAKVPPASTSAVYSITYSENSVSQPKTITRRHGQKIVAALGYDTCTLPLFRNTIQRSRKKARKEYVESAMTEFKPDYPLVVHWDGKLLSESFGLGKVERLSVCVRKWH
ncbi:hypothetical protein AVEN_201852-1 [Araneus ventricosus]|uniref:Uncharacterized protein n=1 Tax=Araneus ventricosus TaxID=182803 RepID=A0A4Y2KN97_ARAVE|nr:hypothetical protein AVEN_201852-1 [Araneus ventricosus]